MEATSLSSPIVPISGNEGPVACIILYIKKYIASMYAWLVSCCRLHESVKELLKKKILRPGAKRLAAAVSVLLMFGSI
jgi:hypothetical protein